MFPRTQDERVQWTPLLIAFLIGLLVGWWVIGWGIWPVQWTNALPQDLRAAERDNYLVMVAESYAATGNLDLARERLAGYPAEELEADFGTLQTRLADENPVQANQVQQLAGALGVYVPPPQPAGPTSAPSLLRRVGTIALWALGVMVGLAAIVYLFQIWRATQNRQAGAITGEPHRAATRSRPATYGGSSADEIAEQAKSTWPEGFEQAAPSDRAVAGQEPISEIPPFLSPEEPMEQLPYAGAERIPATVEPARPSPAAPSGTLVKVGEYLAAYQMGEPDYDEAFDITDSDGAHVGQCGLALANPVGRGNDQAAALQVWLWDMKDPDTKVKVLFSEGAYRDTALRDQLAGQHPAVVVRPGSEFDLETHNLLLRGVIEKIDYAEQEPMYGIFAEMVVRLKVYRKT